jgi:hypothetical protein
VDRVAGELVRTAAGLVRALERSQQKPAPFFGPVLADAVDVAALDGTWGNGLPGSVGDGSVERPVTPGAATEVDPVRPGAGAAAEDAPGAEEVPTAGTAVAGMAGGEMTDIERMEQSAADTRVGVGPGPGSPPEWVVRRLNQRPGWTLDVVRPRASAQAVVGVAPAAT